MSVYIPINIDTVVEQEEQPSLTYALDFENGRIIGRTDGLKAVNQAIKKALITARFKCLIYDNQYGSEIKELVLSKNITRELLEAEMPRMIEDCLSVDTRILKVYDFEFYIAEDKANIKFKADTIFGETSFEGVI